MSRNNPTLADVGEHNIKTRKSHGLFDDCPKNVVCTECHQIDECDPTANQFRRENGLPLLPLKRGV